MHEQFAQVGQYGLLGFFADTGTLRRDFNNLNVHELRSQFLAVSIPAGRWAETESPSHTPAEMYGVHCRND